MNGRAGAAILLFSLCVVPLVVLGQQAPVFQTGLEFADAATYQGIPLASTPLMGDLPPMKDLSDGFPAPGNQGKQASCVGWAVAYGLKSYQERMERQWPVEQHTFSPAYIYNQIRKSADCSGGTSYSDALNLLRKEGVASLADFPYSADDCTRLPSALARQNAGSFRIADWRRVNVQDETEVKNHIVAGFPVLVGAIVDSSFQNLKGPAIYSQFVGPSLGGHAMVVVGYDDNRGAFKLINSWGVGWGDRGFGWVRYAAFRQMTREGYVAQDIVSPMPSPTPAPSPSPTPNRPNPTPNPPPPPVPPPPAIPVASILGIQITHNLTVQHPAGLTSGPGMMLVVQGSVINTAGRTIQIVVRFAIPATGQFLVAHPQEPSFRDASGLVATGTQRLTVTAPTAMLNLVQLQIPYYALNLTPTNGQMTYPINAVATVYIDNFPVGQSMPVLFSVRW
jgi:hypothetical protein